MTNKDLLPCPFCGGKAKFYHDVYGFWLIQCSKCGITTLNKAVKQEVFDDWNRRVDSKKGW